MKNLNRAIFSIFLILTLARCNLFEINFPLGLGVVRFVDPGSSYDEFLS